MAASQVEEAAPAHVRVQPDWVAALVDLAKKTFPIDMTGGVKNVLAQKGKNNFTIVAPIWVRT